MAEILLTIKLILNTLYNIHKRERDDYDTSSVLQ